MMTKYKIIFDKTNCIGTFACVEANPDRWEKGEDGRAILRGAKLNEETGHYELIIDESEYEKNLEAASVCPVFVIKVEPIEDDDDDDEI